MGGDRGGDRAGGSPPRFRGIVQEYSPDKGYGFITPEDRDDGNGDVPVFFRRAPDRKPCLSVGDVVTYLAQWVKGRIEAVRLQLPYDSRGFFGASVVRRRDSVEEAEAAEVSAACSTDGRLALTDIGEAGPVRERRPQCALS